MVYFKVLYKRVEAMRKNIICIGMFLIVLLWSMTTGCFQRSPSDHKHEFYYYVEIFANESMLYELNVPIPESEKIIDDISVKEGSAFISLKSVDQVKYLNIKGSSSVVISSYFSEISSYMNHSLSDDQIYCSISSDISIIIGSLLLVEMEHLGVWYYSYSYICNTSLDINLPNNQTWKDHLPPEYSESLAQGWNTYLIRGKWADDIY